MTDQERQACERLAWRVRDVTKWLTLTPEDYTKYKIEADSLRQGICAEYYEREHASAIRFPSPPPSDALHHSLDEKVRLEALGIKTGRPAFRRGKRLDQTWRIKIVDVWFFLTRTREEYANYRIERMLGRYGIGGEYYYEALLQGISFAPPPPREVFARDLNTTRRADHCGVGKSEPMPADARAKLEQLIKDPTTTSDALCAALNQNKNLC